MSEELERPRGKKGRKPMSPEMREAQSRRAKQLHAEGRLGGAKFGKMGGRPKKDRAAKRVAEAAQADAQARAIIEVFRDAIAPDQPMNIRLKAAEAWLGVEREEAKVSMQEEEHDHKTHSREELLEILNGKLSSGPVAEMMRAKQLEAENMQDADVVDSIADEIVTR